MVCKIFVVFVDLFILHLELCKILTSFGKENYLSTTSYKHILCFALCDAL